MKRLVLLFCSFLMVSQVFAQRSDIAIKYISVPQQYEFLKSVDQYQLNSMTKFYLNKMGFSAYLDNELPSANRCEILTADVLRVKHLLVTKLYLRLTDCNNNEVYISEIGKSYEKEWRLTYQDALRDIFRVMEDEGASAQTILQKNEKDAANVDLNASDLKKDETSEVIKAEVKMTDKLENDEPTTLTIDATPIITETNVMPIAKFSSYTHNNKTFLLRKTTKGYSLYEETSGTGDGLLLLGTITVEDNILTFIDSSDNKKEAYFDNEKNFVIIQDGSSFVYKPVN
ncbi:hypothetical protein ACFQO1_10395 [Jejudonia soesokkakensis]|uniref:Uncharacterized protein n=1 Tax=Jejudonia soesokkakensis TaxID=1323432 RepID=A0ABW2MXB2_9FLAO